MVFIYLRNKFCSSEQGGEKENDGLHPYPAEDFGRQPVKEVGFNQGQLLSNCASFILHGTKDGKRIDNGEPGRQDEKDDLSLYLALIYSLLFSPFVLVRFATRCF